jgi:hypothetical protein
MNITNLPKGNYMITDKEELHSLKREVKKNRILIYKYEGIINCLKEKIELYENELIKAWRVNNTLK